MKKTECYVNDEAMYRYFEEKAKKLFAEFSEEKQSSQESYKLTTDSIMQIYKSLQVVYDEDEAKEEICLIENTLEILDNWIQIEGMEHLLVNNYAAIENGIFLEHSAEGKPKRIREHYKHQFRNAYLGLLLLDEFHVDKNIAKCLIAENSEYAYLIKSSLSKEQSDKKEELQKLKEIIYKTYYISALFHDIGYPLEYYFRIAQEIHEFTPFFKIINPTIKTPFSEVKALLNNSWLFRTVDNTAIMKKYEQNDHGCLSAISFLTNFYFSGHVYSLSSKKRCIIEMAAVAIYKHTNHYDGNNRMIFSYDPISYLLRLCDDLQEWQRFLVLIGNTHNYLQCSFCGNIIRPRGETTKEYWCKCGKQFKKITQMYNKKMNYIDICKGLKLENDENGKITISLDYDCYCLLELLVCDYEAVQYRKKGIENLESMLKYQKYLSEIELNYFLSNNPIKIIEKMVEKSGKSEDDIYDWIGSFPEGEQKENLKRFLDDYKTQLPEWKLRYGDIIEKNTIKYGRKSRRFVDNYMGEIYSLWKYLEKDD